MIANFNNFKEFEPPIMLLCNADNSCCGSINNPVDFKAEYNFMDCSTITFLIYPQTDSFCYDRIRIHKQILLGSPKTGNSDETPSEDHGYFIITKVEEIRDNKEHYKTITAKSCEYELSNIAMPYIGENDGYGTYGSRVLFHETEFVHDLQHFKDVGDAPSIMRTISDYIPGWSIQVDSAFIDPSADKSTLPTRAFETDDTTTVYGFLMNEVAEAFECVILFDVFNRVIHIKSRRDAITGTDVVLSQDSLLDGISLVESDDDRVNCIQVNGNESVSISSVNPFGNNLIYKFTEQYDGSVMSPDLWQIISAWQTAYSDHKNEYVDLMKNVYSLNAQIATLMTVKANLENRQSITQTLKTETSAMVTLTAEAVAEKESQMTYYDTLIGMYADQIQALEQKIATLKTNLTFAEDGISTIINGLDFHTFISERVSDSNKASTLYIELMRLIRTYSYTNKNIVMPDSIKNIPSVDSIPPIESFSIIEGVPQSNEQRITAYSSAFNSWFADYPDWVSNTVEPKIESQFKVVQSLYDVSMDMLTRTAQPRCEIDIDSSNFVFVKDFAHLSEQIKTGCSIRIEKPNGEIVTHYVLKINVDYSGKDFSMTLSNRYRLNDALSIFEDGYGNTASIASVTANHAVILEEQKKQINALEIARQQSLNYTKQAILSAENQEITVDDSGMTIKTVTSIDENGTRAYDPYQFKLANGSILFTEDGWQTAGLAVGKYYDPRSEKWRMGINGEHIMANTIEASSLTVGSISNTTGTNLIRDGSFDGNIQGEIDEGRESAWQLYGVEGNYDPRRVETRNLIYGKGTTKNTYTTDISLIRLGMGTSMKRNITLPVFALDGTWYLCAFLRGQITISARLFNPTGQSDTVLKQKISGKMLNYLNTTNETDNVKNLGCVELFNVSDLSGGNATIDIVITYDNAQTTGLNYAELSSIFITDRYGNICNLDEDTSDANYAKNHCHNFTMFPNRFWSLQTIDTTGRKKVDSLPIEYVSATDACNGLCIQNNKNYVLIGTKGFSLKNKTDYTYSISVNGNNGSSVLVNSYLIKESLMTKLDNLSNTDLGDYLDDNYEGTVLKKFSTYIDLKGTQETGYDEITFGAENNYTDVCLVCLISANVSSGKKIYIKSVCIRQSGTELNSIKEIRLNPWCNKPSESFLYFSYDLLQHEKRGGFDDGAFISMPPGTGLSQREKFVVFEGLPYYVSCYAKGHFDMSVFFYSSKESNVPINNEEDEHIRYTYTGNSAHWTRVHCETPIIAPVGAKYANILLNATEDESYAGCQVDGVMFEQSTVLNAYQSNDSELFAQYTTINNDGVTIHNGKIRIYNDANKLVLHGDEYGNLEIEGKITATSGKIGGWTINEKSLSSKNGTSIIDPEEGSFISKADDTTLTKLNSGYLKFENESNTGYIGFTGSTLSIGSENVIKIMKQGNNSFPIIEFSDSINIRRPVSNQCTFSDGLVALGDIISTSKVYSGGTNYYNEVVTFGDYNQLVDDVNNLRSAVEELASAVENANVNIPSGDAETGGSGTGSETGTQTISYDWDSLLVNMRNYSGCNNAYTGDAMAKCYNIARDAKKTDGTRYFTYYSSSNIWQNKYAAYTDWANTCGMTISYQ